MLKKILLSCMFLLMIVVANEPSYIYEQKDYKAENQILKLQLEIYELKSKNNELARIIEQMQLNEKKVEEDEVSRGKAIVELRRELRLRKDR